MSRIIAKLETVTQTLVLVVVDQFQVLKNPQNICIKYRLKL